MIKNNKKIETYRQDALLSRLAKRNGGHYIVIEKNHWVNDLSPFIKETGAIAKSKIKTSGKNRFIRLLFNCIFGWFLLDSFLLLENKKESLI